MIASRKALIIVAAFVLMAIGMPWGGNVPAAFAQISVTAADPPTGEQGTLNLNVIIKGKGFKNGAKAKFYKTGTTDPAGVNVKSTQYVSSTQLVATIDIADTAALAAFDIQVMNTDGRTGKGTELFSVTVKKVDPCTLPDPLPTDGYFSDPPGLPGSLDITFGNGTGKIIGPAYMEPQSAAIQQVGGEARIVVVGSTVDKCQASTYRVWTIVRYLPDGRRDASFGTNGIVTTRFLNNAWAYGVAIDRNNKIVVGGMAPTTKRGNLLLPILARYNTNGSLDTTFGTGGTVVVSGSYNGRFIATIVQSDGRIIGVGCSGGFALVVRLDADGHFDGTFNGNGQYLYTEDPDGASCAYAVTTQAGESGERIVVGGMISDTYFNTHYRFGLWRLTSSGTPDSSFGTAGVVAAGFGGYHDFLTGVGVDPDSRIVTAGYTCPDSSVSTCRTVVARFDDSGNLDPSFADGGKVLPPAQMQYEFADVVAIQPDGGLLVGGYSHSDTGSIQTATIWRFTGDGTPDVTFGVLGRVDDPIASGATYAALKTLVPQGDGRVVWVGFVDVQSIRYAALGRVWQ
jgi:uncharacterized delta-60 repeat protein